MISKEIRRASGPWRVRKEVTFHLPPSQGEVYLPLYPPPRDDLGPKVLAPKPVMSPLALLVCIVFYKVFCTFRVPPIGGDASWVYKNCYFA